MKRKCPMCNGMVSTQDYAPNAGKSDNCATYCKICMGKLRVGYKASDLLELRTLRDNVKKYGCCLCQERALFCLDFHHVNPLLKTNAIPHYISNRHKKGMVRELLKTVTLCANCHRKVEHGAAALPDRAVQEFQVFLRELLLNTKYAKYLPFTQADPSPF